MKNKIPATFTSVDSVVPDATIAKIIFMKEGKAPDDDISTDLLKDPEEFHKYLLSYLLSVYEKGRSLRIFV